MIFSWSVAPEQAGFGRSFGTRNRTLLVTHNVSSRCRVAPHTEHLVDSGAFLAFQTVPPPPERQTSLGFSRGTTLDPSRPRNIHLAVFQRSGHHPSHPGGVQSAEVWQRRAVGVLRVES